MNYKPVPDEPRVQNVIDMSMFSKRMIMTLLVCCSISASYALKFAVDKISYETLSDSTVKVTGFDFSLIEVTIPSTVEYKNVIYQVKEIGYRGLLGFKSSPASNSKMTKLVISEGIEKIGESGVASNGYLKTVSLPASLKEIGNKGFYKLGALQEYTIPDSNNLTRIGDEAFSECPNLFKGKPLLLPTGITEIGSKAFYNNNFTSVVIPKNVTVINEQTFANCSLLTSAILHNGITRIENGAFMSDEQLDYLDYDFPENLEYIGNSAFWKVPGIKHLILHGNLGKINATSFGRCKNLEYVWVKEGITSIDGGAFTVCEKLKYIILPSTLKTIETTAFGGFDNENHINRTFVILANEPYETKVSYVSDYYSINRPDYSTYSFGLISDGDCFFVKESALSLYKTRWSICKNNLYYKIPFNSELSYSTNYREFDTDYHVTAVNGNKPFIATGFTGESATFTSIDDGIVPAGTAVLIRKKSDENTWYQIAEQQGAQLNTTNYLKGVTYADEIPPYTEDGFINYVLYNGEFCRFNNAGILGDHKAYLQLPETMTSKYTIVFTDDVTNGISEISSEESESTIYNLSGLRVINPTKGIYIKNGKKIIIK